MTRSRRLLEAAVCFVIASSLLVVAGGLLDASDGSSEPFIAAGARTGGTAAGVGLIVWAITLGVAALRRRPVRRPVVFAIVSALIAAVVNVAFWAIAALFMGGWAFFFVAITALGSVGLAVSAALAACATWLLLFKKRAE